MKNLKEFVAAIIENGGATYNLANGGTVDKGYMVSKKGFEMKFQLESRDEAIDKKLGIPNWDGAGVDVWYKDLTEVYANESKKFLNKLKKKKNVDYDDVVELSNLIGQDLTDGGNDFIDEDDLEWVDDSALQVCYAVAEKLLEESKIKFQPEVDVTESVHQFILEEQKVDVTQAVCQFIKEFGFELYEVENFMGAWIDEGVLYLDVSNNFAKRSDAIREGYKNEQLAIFDVVAQESLYLPTPQKTGTMTQQQSFINFQIGNL